MVPAVPTLTLAVPVRPYLDTAGLEQYGRKKLYHVKARSRLCTEVNIRAAVKIGRGTSPR